MAFRLAWRTRIMMLMVPMWSVVSQLTASIPLSSRCRSLCGGLASGRYYGPGNGLGDDVAWLVTGRNINALR
jgi:hypothetical protein